MKKVRFTFQDNSTLSVDNVKDVYINEFGEAVCQGEGVVTIVHPKDGYFYTIKDNK